MNRLEYRGYCGSIEFSKSDSCFYGKVLYTHRDCITYEGVTMDELKDDFEGAIDFYLSHCKENGIHPEKPYLSVPFAQASAPALAATGR